MCNKVLRNAPGRQTTYLKLAKLYAAKGFVAEAKQNFVEYAGRMQKIGKIQHAFAALKEFTDISPENAHLRSGLEEHLKMYGDAERHPPARVAPGGERGRGVGRQPARGLRDHRRRLRAGTARSRAGRYAVPPRRGYG